MSAAQPAAGGSVAPLPPSVSVGIDPATGFNAAGAYKPGRGQRVDATVDTVATAEHLYYVFDRWPVLRPGLREFLIALRERRAEGQLKQILIYTANNKIEWVKFVMKAMLQYFELPTDTFNGIRQAPGGLKIVPESEVLYDDHPENVEGNCVAVDPYNNEVPWSVLEPLFADLPDDGKGGKKSYIEKDKRFPEKPHEPESEATLFEFSRLPSLGMEEFSSVDVALLDLDETLIAGGRASAYFFAIGHFLNFAHQE